MTMRGIKVKESDLFANKPCPIDLIYCLQTEVRRDMFEVVTGTTPFGVMEVRIHCGGDGEIIFGIPFGVVEGATLPEKLKHLLELDQESFAKLSRDKGVLVSMFTVGDFVVLPSGWLYIQASYGGSSVRWGTAGGAADDSRVKSMVNQMLDAYPSLADSPYKRWSEHLSKAS